MWIEEMVWNCGMWIKERMDGEEGARGGGGFKGATSGGGVAACAHLLTRLRESPSVSMHRSRYNLQIFS